MIRGTTRIRFAEQSDIASIVKLEKEVWGFSGASADTITARLHNYPKGNLVAISDDGRICGFASFCIIDYENYEDSERYSWYDLSGNGTASTHDPCALDLFGISLGVAYWAPKNTSAQLIGEVVRCGVRAGVRRGLLGARICGYHRYAHDMTAFEYAWTERKGRSLDPEIHFYSKLGLRPVKLVENYFEDPKSLNWGMIFEMSNPFFNPKPLRLISKLLAVLPVNMAKLMNKFN